MGRFTWRREIKGRFLRWLPDGKGELFYASDEAHIKTLAFDAKGNLLAGTEPNGRVLRVTRNAEKSAKRKSTDEAVADGFVVYETAKREVTSLTVAQDGTIYVAAIGEKTRTVGMAPSAVIATSQGTTTITNVGLHGADAGDAVRGVSAGDFQQHLPDIDGGSAG